MPELPDVETVRRMIAGTVVGRTIRRAWVSGMTLRGEVPVGLTRRVRGRTVAGVGRHGKYLLVHLDEELTLVSHLGMSGRWLFFPTAPADGLPHVHACFAFADGAVLWFQDPRRFGLLRVVPTGRLGHDSALRDLGPDPLDTPLRAADFLVRARGRRVSVKSFLMDQRRVAGLGNIYASEVLFRAGVDPRCRAGELGGRDWRAICTALPRILRAAIARMGTTFRTYRTIWDEPGQFAERLAIYDRAGEPCRRCRTPIRRIVQGQRSTFFCPRCQATRRTR